MRQIIFIVIGGSLGAISRYGLSKYVSLNIHDIFPWGTLLINLTGSFLIGFLFELFERAIIPSEWRSLIAIGFLGSYTTFSTYSLETLHLLREGEIKAGLVNVFASNLLGITLVFLGMECSRFLVKIWSR